MFHIGQQVIRVKGYYGPKPRVLIGMVVTIEAFAPQHANEPPGLIFEGYPPRIYGGKLRGFNPRHFRPVAKQTSIEGLKELLKGKVDA